MVIVDYIAKYLRDFGVKHIFGYQGGGISPLIESISNTEGLQYVQLYQEQGAGFAADAYGRISQKLGVCLVTNGPGVTNLISSIANAQFDYSPCLFFTGQVNVYDMNTIDGVRQNGFQEVETGKIVANITKYFVSIRNKNDIKYELDKAISIAMKAPKGAVVVELPLDIQKSEINENELESYSVQNESKMEMDFSSFIKELNKSKRPVLLAGGGVRAAQESEQLLKEFVALTKIPVVCSLQGLDIYTENNYGFAGLYGSIFANLALYNADLIIGLGCRFSKRQIGIFNKYSKNAGYVQVDENEKELSRVVSAINYKCDISYFLRSVLELIKRDNLITDYKEWNGEIANYQSKYSGQTEFNQNSVQPVTFIENLSKYLTAETDISLDVGQNQMWCAQGLKLKEGQRIITSAGLGCMGFSLPASIGAYYANGAKCIAFMGDGGFQMNMQELNFIASNKIPVKIFVFNNNSLGMIQEVQMKFQNQHYIGTKIGYNAPNFSKLAAAYDIEYHRIVNNEIDDTIKEKLDSEVPVLFEICITDNPSRLLNKYDVLNLFD